MAGLRGKDGWHMNRPCDRSHPTGSTHFSLILASMLFIAFRPVGFLTRSQAPTVNILGAKALVHI
jgi:hypothetical protein